MAELSYPNPSVTQNQHERLMGGAAGSGVYGYPTDQPVVYAPGAGTRELRLRANRRAVVEGYGWETDAGEVVLPSLAANSSGSVRIDLVVLRLNRATYQVRAAVLQGTPGAGAPSPSFSSGTSGVWELPLAEVTVDPNITVITGSKVKDRAWYLGSDGQYRCGPDSRPPHEAGRVVWEHPTGVGLMSTGDRWLRFVEDASGAITGVSGFTYSGQMLYRRNGFVTFTTALWRPSAPLNANTEYVVARIPDGFRPVAHTSSTGVCPTLNSILTYGIEPGGDVLINPSAVTISANRAVVLAAVTYPHA